MNVNNFLQRFNLISISQFIKYDLCLVFILCLLDSFLTIFAIENRYAYELNPMMDFLIQLDNNSYVFFLFFKLLTSLFCLYVLYILRKESPRFICFCLILITTVYLIVDSISIILLYNILY